MYEQQAPKRRRGPLVASTAAVVIVILLGVVGACADHDDPATTTSPGARRTIPSGTAQPSPTATVSNPPTAPTTATAAKATTRPSAKPAKVTYAKLTERQWLRIAKNPDRYAGKGYVVYGQITQFDSATGDDTFRADVGGVRKYPSYGYVDYDTNTILTGDADTLSDFVADDLFRAQVVVVGSYEYETTLGGSMTVPLLLIKSIKNLGSAK